jgi:hypothetical protein
MVHPLPKANGAKGGKNMGAAAIDAGWKRPEWCSVAGVAGVLCLHQVPALFGCSHLLFLEVLPMVPPLLSLACRGPHVAPCRLFPPW